MIEIDPLWDEGAASATPALARRIFRRGPNRPASASHRAAPPVPQLESAEFAGTASSVIG
jgi:hypothetical protein